MRDRTKASSSRHQFEVSYVQRRVIQQAIVDDEDVPCGCRGECVHAPVLEEIVLPSLRPAHVGMTALDRPGLVAFARRRGMPDAPIVR